ncbi:MAG: hypothetical protein KDI42_07980 [Gammaproteobacteria bacterium]|nr:hypothetical protein [Gammaproteobacteria bacterium]
MKHFTTTNSILLVSAVLALATLSGCEGKGPAEKAGAKMDNAVEQAGEKLEEAGDSIKDAIQSDGK